MKGGEGPNQIENVKVELTSENDLFFHYTHIITKDSFCEMQEEQKLMVSFQEYARVFIKMANSCIKEPHR
jgi:cold shock CspA family protein